MLGSGQEPDRAKARFDARVLVVGGSSGIGRATALRLAAGGATLTCVGREAGKLDEVFAALARASGVSESASPHRCVAGDALDLDFLERVIGEASADLVVLSLGRVVTAEFLEADLADWRSMLDTNVFAVMAATRLAADDMVRRGAGGHVVLIGSALSSRAVVGASAYATCKAAVRMFARAARLELAASNVRVTEISPGLVGDTDFKRDSKAVEGFDERPYEPISSDDVARAVEFAATSPAGVGIDRVEVMPHGQF